MLKNYFLCTFSFDYLSIFCLSALSWTFNMKLPTPRIRYRNFTFSKEQQIWLIKHSATMNVTQLCQAFFVQFLDRTKHAQAPHRWAFQRLIHWFDLGGGVAGGERQMKTDEQQSLKKTSTEWRSTSPRIKRPAYENPPFILNCAMSQFGISLK